MKDGCPLPRWLMLSQQQTIAADVTAPNLTSTPVSFSYQFLMKGDTVTVIPGDDIRLYLQIKDHIISAFRPSQVRR